MANPLRCIHCGMVVPPERTTQLDERYHTGWCHKEDRKVALIRASTPEEAVAHRPVRRRKTPAIPLDAFPPDTDFSVRSR